MMFASLPQAADKKLVEVKSKSGEKKEEDFATAFQSQSMYIFPINDWLFLLRLSDWPIFVLEYFHNFWYHTAVQNFGFGRN